MGTYKCSDGLKVNQSQIDYRIRQAKEEKLKDQFDEHGFNFCENCNRNSFNTYLDCSHDISVKKAKETGQSELCWDVENITILCRECHQKKDRLNIQFSNYGILENHK